MSSSKLTLIGFYNWMNANDENLFVNLQPPSAVDRNALVNNILLRGGEFEVLYSDPDFLQAAIAPWNTKWLPTMTKWVNALAIEYDPLYNYDRREEWTTETEGQTSGTASSESTGNVENTVSAYNSSTYQPERNSDSSGSSSTEDATSSSGTETRTGRAYGNIGVTTTQQMLEQELEIAKFNLIDQITDLFLAEFVIPIY